MTQCANEPTLGREGRSTGSLSTFPDSSVVVPESVPGSVDVPESSVDVAPSTTSAFSTGSLSTIPDSSADVAPSMHYASIPIKRGQLEF